MTNTDEGSWHKGEKELQNVNHSRNTSQDDVPDQKIAKPNGIQFVEEVPVILPGISVTDRALSCRGRSVPR